MGGVSTGDNIEFQVNHRSDSGVFILKYNPFMRLVVLLFFMLGVLIGTMFLLANGTNLFLQILGGVIIIYSVVMLFDVLLFVRMEIDNKEIKKRWLFGTYVLKVYDVTKVNKFSYKGITRGYIRFYSKSNYFTSFIMIIHLLALDNYREEFEKLKEVLKKNQLLKGVNYKQTPPNGNIIK